MTFSDKSKERTRFGKFALVGIAGGVIDFTIFNLLATLLGINSIVASVISFSLAVVNNFLLNRAWTFPESRNRHVIKQLIQFAIVSVIGLAIRTPLFAWLEKQLIPLAAKVVPNLFTPTFIGHNISLGIAILVIMLWNFVANRYWTFNTVSSKLSEDPK